MKRTASGLREFLFDALEDCRDGRLAPEDALASAKIAEVIIKSVEMEIKYRRELTIAKKEGHVLPILGDVVLAPESTHVPAPGAPKMVRGKDS